MDIAAHKTTAVALVWPCWSNGRKHSILQNLQFGAFCWLTKHRRVKLLWKDQVDTDLPKF